MGKRATRGLEPDDLYTMRLASDPQLSPDGGTVAYVQSRPDKDNDSNHSSIWLCPAGGGASFQRGETSVPTEFTRGPEDANPRWSPDGRKLGFIRKKDLLPQVWVISLDGGEARQITRAPLGVMEFAWSADGQTIAFTAPMSPKEDAGDEKQEGPAAPFEIKEMPYKFDSIGFSKGLKPHLFVIGLDEEEARRLTEGDFSVTTPAWSPDGKEIAFISAMHPERGLDLATHLYVIDVATKDFRQLTSGPTTATTPVWTPDGKTIVFAGRREATVDTLMHVFSIESKGGEPVDLTPDFDRNVLAGIFGFPGARIHLTSEGGSLIFAVQDGGCIHVFEVGIAGGSPTKVVGGDERVIFGLHAGARITFTASSYDMPMDVFVAEPDGSDERRLTRLNEDTLAGKELMPYQRRQFTTRDGTEVEGFLLDKGGDEPRPLLLNVHGGPHAAWGPFFPFSDLYSGILAAQGWAVLLLNPRGSDGYGEGFTRALRAGWGVNDLNDFTSAIDELVAEGVADADRLAVTGYSYGGYMTNWLVTQTDRFAVAVTGAGVTNLASMYGTADIGAWFMNLEMQAEAYEKPDIYAALSPITHVTNVNTPILLLHGQADDRVPLGQAEEWFVALKRQQKPVLLVVYPEAAHVFPLLGRPSHRVDYSRRLIDWVTTHVMGISK